MGNQHARKGTVKIVDSTSRSGIITDYNWQEIGFLVAPETALPLPGDKVIFEIRLQLGGLIAIILPEKLNTL